jgi:hypothetical protein
LPPIDQAFRAEVLALAIGWRDKLGSFGMYPGKQCYDSCHSRVKKLHDDRRRLTTLERNASVL